MVLSINDQQLKRLKTFESANDYVGGWRYLASIGDRYADNAYAAVVEGSAYSEGRLFTLLVRHHWKNTAETAAYEQKFAQVALQHFENYVRIVDRERGKLPTSEQIERSYRDAVENAGLAAYTAFDGVFTQSIGSLTGKNVDWADFLRIEAARQVESHVFDDLDSTRSWKLVASALSTASLEHQGEIRIESSRVNTEALSAVIELISETVGNVRLQLNDLSLPAGAFTEPPFSPQVLHPVVAPTTAPQTPVPAPLAQVSTTPMRATTVDAPMQPVQPALLATGTQPDLHTPILLVRHILEPVHRLSIERFLNGDMGHPRIGRCPMPVLFTRREPHHVAGADLAQFSAPALGEAAAGGDDQGLAERVRVPGRARAGLEGHGSAA